MVSSRVSFSHDSLSSAATRKSDQAYRVLKKAILALDLRPGELLVEADLMDQLEIGRTPLREALQRLDNEGLVTTVPRRGTFVSSITSEDVQAIHEMRCNLDSFAARLAAQRASDSEIAEMESLLHRVEAGEIEDHTLFDHEMHELILRAAHNTYLEDTQRRIYALSVRLFNLNNYERESLGDMVNELSAVVDAIRRRDPDEAATAAERHVTSRGWFPGRP